MKSTKDHSLWKAPAAEMLREESLLAYLVACTIIFELCSVFKPGFGSAVGSLRSQRVW